VEERDSRPPIHSQLETSVMTWVKICGITNLEDALVAVDAGADALGFVFYEKSPRKVDVETVRGIVTELPAGLETVGVFVGDWSTEWLRNVRQAGLKAVQHVVTKASQADPSQVVLDLTELPPAFRIYASWPIADFLQNESRVQALASEFARMRKNGSRLPDGIFDTFFLDSGHAREPGGTGVMFDWRKAVPIAEGMRQGGLKLVVAGGLNPGNVVEAIEVLKPWGVDVSSGVEARPGKKDSEKVRAFVHAVRCAEKSV